MRFYLSRGYFGHDYWEKVHFFKWLWYAHFDGRVHKVEFKAIKKATT